MGLFQKKPKVKIASHRPSDASVGEALRKGNVLTRLSLVVFGLGNIVNKQFVRGFVFLALEAAYIYYMISFGAQALVNMTTLGTVEQQKVYNEALGIYEYAAGDNSMLFLLYALLQLSLHSQQFLRRVCFSQAHTVRRCARTGGCWSPNLKMICAL